jgi:FAD dependent oxidoreductase
MIETDYLIVGGGLFGAYTALYLAEKNYKVCLLEKEDALFTKASVINQSRLHHGYHYPRSISTAKMAYEYKDRFIHDHKPFINTQFENYYAIDNYASFTNSMQFERFCNYIEIPAKKIKDHPLINMEQIEALYLTDEYTFDPIQVAEFYKNKINTNKNITVVLQSKIEHADRLTGKWKITYTLHGSPSVHRIKSSAVINATYTGTNSINAVFGMKDLDLMYEISEIVFVHSPEFQGTGLTILDGPFASCMPYGLSGELSLSSVLYTHHKVSYASLPVFACQEINKNCLPEFVEPCTSCTARPASNGLKMILQIKKYLRKEVTMQYVRSLFTIKTKLKSSYIDDGRPTEISKMSDRPSYYCLFSGKINSIYEIEKLLSNEF